MLTVEEAQDLINNLLVLKAKAKETNDKIDILKHKRHENLCVDKFKYLITMRTGKYKSFSNYDDLNQEGMEALVKAIKTYNPKKGNWFWWAHKYIDTRISRSANLHTTIRYPLKIAKANTPHKEAIMPLLIEERYCPDKQYESMQLYNSLETATNLLSKDQKKIIDMAFGFNGDKPLSINKICKKLNISRVNCVKEINSALALIKENIKV